MIALKPIVTIMSLASGNFTYQYVLADFVNYGIALERSFFQSIAVLLCYFTWGRK